MKLCTNVAQEERMLNLHCKRNKIQSKLLSVFSLKVAQMLYTFDEGMNSIDF